MESDILISVVIPHYNMVDSCIRLISTIPDRDEIEIIVADDNSEEPLSRLKESLDLRNNKKSTLLESKTKGGAGERRNAGVLHAHGEWLLFADADDLYLDNMWDVIEPYLKSDYDIVYFTPIGYNNNGRQKRYEDLINRYINDKNSTTEAILNYKWDAPWSKLIRRKLFSDNHIRFDNTICANDVMGSLRSAYCAKKIFATGDSIYCITDRHMSADKSFDSRIIRLNVLLDKYMYLKDRISSQELSALDIESQVLNVVFKHFKATRNLRETSALWNEVKKRKLELKTTFIIRVGLNTFFGLKR